MSYFYTWTPLFIIFGTATVLTIPYLALVVLLLVAVALLAALVRLTIVLPYRFVRGVNERRHELAEATPQPATYAYATTRVRSSL